MWWGRDGLGSTWRKLAGRYCGAHWHLLRSRFLNRQCWGMGKCGHLFCNTSWRLLDYLKQWELLIQSFNLTCFRKEQAFSCNSRSDCAHLTVNIPLHQQNESLLKIYICTSQNYLVQYHTIYFIFRVEFKFALYTAELKPPFGSYFHFLTYGNFQIYTKVERKIKWNHLFHYYPASTMTNSLPILFYPFPLIFSPSSNIFLKIPSISFYP